MNTEKFLNNLFPKGRECHIDNNVITGYASAGKNMVSVVGTTDSAELAPDMILKISSHVIETIEQHPGYPIIILCDTKGQKLSRKAESLGMNAYVSHLLKTLQLARIKKHHTISVVYGYGWGAAILALGLSADQTYGLKSSNIGEMTLEAMSKVTLLSVERLQKLSETCATFAPGADNFIKLGGITDIWEEDQLSDKLIEALSVKERTDNRSLTGLRNKGRTLSYTVCNDVINC
jgi:malonate decarboxylase gamma subunit